jgi:3-hydroxyacyl-CoA dehydrogenase
MGGAAPIQTVLVIGYGTMGRGVLRSFSTHGFTTTICSMRSADQLTDLPPGVLTTGPGLPSGPPPDLIVENIPEDMSLKLELLRKIEVRSSISCSV